MGAGDFSDMIFSKDLNSRSVNSLRARTVFVSVLRSRPYNAGQRNGLTLEYKTMVAGAVAINAQPTKYK